MSRFAVLVMGLLCALTAAACVHSSYSLASHTSEYSMTSDDKEVALGRKLAKQVEKEETLVPDDAMQNRVRAIGQRLVAVCDRQELVYSFAVIKEEEVNAFSLPGGYVFLNEGLVKKVASDDELAAVIGHEIGHVVARHAMKRYEGSLGTQLLQLATLATRSVAAAQGVSVAIQATQLAYARQEELEADRFSVKYLKAAGFDPKATISFLERLQQLERDKPHYLPRGVVRPEYGMTHPFVPDRLRAVKEALYGIADYLDYLNTHD